LLFLFSSYFGTLAKQFLKQPRPFEYDPRIKQLFAAPPWGFPSIHTQNAIVVWGYLAIQIKKAWFWVLAISLMILIPLSRLYLGLHFPTDLLGGYILGALLLCLFLNFSKPLENWLMSIGILWRIIMAVLFPIILMALLPSQEPNAISAGSLFIGISLGVVIENQWVRFDPSTEPRNQASKLILGIISLFVLRFGLKLLFTSLTPETFFLGLRYALIGCWFSAGAPWAFIKLGLAQKR
jgi:hypothetical protein